MQGFSYLKNGYTFLAKNICIIAFLRRRNKKTYDVEFIKNCKQI